MASLVETWESEIRRDLLPFVDPGTTILLSAKGDVIEAVWTQRRKVRTASFVIKGPDGVLVEYCGRELSYRSFLALEDMGDVLGIAQTTASIYPKQIYVDTFARVEPEGQLKPALELLRDGVGNGDPSAGLTPFVMVTAEAGAGKTSMLKELVRRQACDFAAGTANFVFLYVNAQGRALARFHEALATELNELRVSVPYHAIAVLVRHGLVVPVVDGFDELLGAGGYDEAFASIWSFIQELDGRGAMVTSARSTYYEQEFLARSERANAEDRGGWLLQSISLSGWDDAQRRSYVEAYVAAHGGDIEEIWRELAKVFAGERHELSDKPLFVARTVRVIASGGRISGEGSLISRLADEFIAREISEKLTTKEGAPILTHTEMDSLCADFAEEMWNLGTRELDRLTVSELAELAMSGGDFARSDKEVVIARMPNMAFLEPGESAGAVAFEHELFFDHFLASRAAESVVRRSPGLPLLLSRAPMPDSLTDGIARAALDEEVQLAVILDSLNAAAETRIPNRELVRENCGRVAAAFISRSNERIGPIPEVDVRGLIFPGSSLANTDVEKAHFENVEFKRVDLRGARFRSGTAVGCVFESIVIDAGTLLQLSDVDPQTAFRGVRLSDSEGIRVLYEPTEILAALREASLPAAMVDAVERVRAVDRSVVDIVAAYVKASAKSNPLCVSENPFEFRPDRSKWASISRLGEAAGVFRIEFRQARGPKTPFTRRLFRGDEIMLGRVMGADVADAISDFWARLEEAFPEAGQRH